MNKPSSIDEQSFRRLLSRNVGLPLGVGVLSAAVFISIIVYLLSVIDWVEHTDRVINNANEATKLSIDMETGMRGYLLSGGKATWIRTNWPSRAWPPNFRRYRRWWPTTRARSTGSRASWRCKRTGSNTANS